MIMEMSSTVVQPEDVKTYSVSIVFNMLKAL